MVDLLGDDVSARASRVAVLRTSGRSGHGRVWAFALVAVVLSPIVVGALSLVGETWFPVGDWASMLYRTSRVGTADSPLVGPYSVKGWAHPGPMLYWLAAPPYRLAGGDPRSLLWTAATINLASVVAIGGVAWRRGRGPLLAGVMLMVALLVHGLGPDRLVDSWNPLVSLLPFLLAVILLWDAALGRPRSALLAVIPGSFAVQSHVSFGALLGVAALWLLAWIRWWPRLLPGVDADAPGTGSGLVDVRLPRPAWDRWRRVVRSAVVAGVVLWALPLVDLVVDMHNLASVAGHLAVRSGEQIGLSYGGSLVSRYVLPNGPWMGGPEPELILATQGSGPAPFAVVLALLAGCLYVGRRRRLVDVVALASLAIVLVVAAVPAAANLVAPAFSYLTQWLKVIGAFVWLTVGWTLWRIVEPWVRMVPRRLVVAGLVGTVAVSASAAWSWGDATTLEPPVPVEGEVVQQLRPQVRDRMPADRAYDVQNPGDVLGHNGPGLIFYMIEDGYDVRTSDGTKGLKWGHEHRWTSGDRIDTWLTVAVHYPGSLRDVYSDCLGDAGAQELVASYDALSPDERAELDDLRLQRVSDAEALTAADERRADDLEAGSFRVGVFAGDEGCGDQREDNGGGE